MRAGVRTVAPEPDGQAGAQGASSSHPDELICLWLAGFHRSLISRDHHRSRLDENRERLPDLASSLKRQVPGQATRRGLWCAASRSLLVAPKAQAAAPAHDPWPV
jgi:hypothetical protein